MSKQHRQQPSQQKGKSGPTDKKQAPQQKQEPSKEPPKLVYINLPVKTKENLGEFKQKFDERFERYETLVWANKEITENIESLLTPKREEVADKLISHASKYSSTTRPLIESINKYEEEAQQNFWAARREYRNNLRAFRVRMALLLNKDENLGMILRKQPELTRLINWDSSAAILTSTGWSKLLIDKKAISKPSNSQLGEGAFGRVYRGIVYGNIVAIKELKDLTPGENDPKLSMNSKIKSLEDECKILSEIKHDRILKFMGACLEYPKDNKEPGYYALLTELAENGSLHDILYPKKNSTSVPVKLSFNRKMHIIGEIVEGMHVLHKFDPPILHLDLKCANILLDDEFHVRIADFGLSRLQQKGLINTAVGGTPYYMAPEALDKKSLIQSAVSEKSDVYSFAILVNELLDEKIPYKGVLEKPTFETLVETVLGGEEKGKNRPILVDKKKCPVDFQNFIMKCWSSDPKKRPSFDQMRNTKEWEVAAITAASSGEKFGKGLIECFTGNYEKSIPFDKFVSKLRKTYELEGKLSDANDGANAYIRALKVILNIGNITEKVEKERAVIFNNWFQGVKPTELLQQMYALCAQPWFWGHFKFGEDEHDTKCVKYALSKKENSKPGTFLVYWENGNFNLAYVEAIETKDKKDKKAKKELKITQVPLGNMSIQKLTEMIPKKVKELNLKCANDRPPEIRTVAIKETFIVGSASGCYTTSGTVQDTDIDISTHNTHYNFII